MQLGMVGLGRMGANIVRRLMAHGHECVVYDVDPEAVKTLAGEGATGTNSMDDFAAKLTPPRTAWVMVPAGSITHQTVDDLAQRLQPDDVIIDGGNTFYRDDIERAKGLIAQGIHYVDVGTSGGVWGLERGYCLMIGGENEVVQRLSPLFAAIAPGVDAAARTPGREGDPVAAEQGYLHCGPAGAGHFVKMVHNGIEYGLMASYAEGLNILRNANAGNVKRESDAETAPLEHPEYYQYDIDIAAVAEVWRRGSVIASWLLDLIADSLNKSPDLHEYSGRVSDSGEGRWTAIAAIEEGVPAPVLSSALFSRFESRDLDQFANQVLSAMRKQFGGHAEKPSAPRIRTLVCSSWRSQISSNASPTKRPPVRSRSAIYAVSFRQSSFTALPRPRARAPPRQARSTATPAGWRQRPEPGRPGRDGGSRASRRQRGVGAQRGGAGEHQHVGPHRCAHQQAEQGRPLRLTTKVPHGNSALERCPRCHRRRTSDAPLRRGGRPGTRQAHRTDRRHPTRRWTPRRFGQSAVAGARPARD